MSCEKHTHMITSKWFRSIIANIYNILRYVIPHVLRHMCNLHIKGTKISQKRTKGIKHWKITYSVILSVLSNKTNLILGFSSPLKVNGRRTQRYKQRRKWTKSHIINVLLTSLARSARESICLLFFFAQTSLLRRRAPPPLLATTLNQAIFVCFQPAKIWR